MSQIIIATHIVKPSSPTPLASKIHKLSSLDQMAPSSYIPLIFFYENDESRHQEQVSQRLKQSLSEILTIFYPLAGTIKKNSFVDCNDSGAEFVEARVHGRLAQFLQNPKMEELRQLVNRSSHNGDLILSVKTSHFDCGGIAVGVCLSHKIADAASAVAFMNAWAATCRGEEASRIIHPSFDLAVHFPPREFSSATEPHDWVVKEKLTTKRLVFDSEKLEKLRNSSTTNVYPSRVEAVTAFMWRTFIDATKAKSPSPENFSSAALVIVNLRPRTFPRLPDHTFGNCVAPCSVLLSSEENIESASIRGVLVSKVRAAIRATDDDYIKNEKYFSSVNEAADSYKLSLCFLCTSWLWFPYYEVDFGWGKPVWVCTVTLPLMNAVVLMDTPSGDGVEAWVNVPDADDVVWPMLQANYNKHL